MVDRSAQGVFEAMQALRAEAATFREVADTLKGGDGSGTSSSMESRVSKLETHMDYVRSDLAEIKGDLKTVVATLSSLPTKRDLTANIIASIAIGLAVLAIVVGGIIGGLGWIQAKVPPSPPAIATTK
jgi:hypothetical protein